MMRLRAFYAACLLCLVSACSTCADQVLSESASPNGVLIATSFVRNCGATTDFSSIVSLHRKSDGLGTDQDMVFVAKGRHQLSLRWSDATTLAVRCDTCSRASIFRQVAIAGDVNIDYQVGSTIVEQK